jgi:NAD-dependent deacetylase
MASGSIVVLTGAGISKESGLSTFRDADGIWATVRIEDVATPEAFARDPVRVHAFYNQRRRGMLDPAIRPNPAHLALARLEREWRGGEVLIVTQNIDDLHEQAGSPNLIHMHGELRRRLCAHCGARAAHTGDLSVSEICPECGKPGGLRPDVVWFGEIPREMDRIHDALAACGIFVSIGTSGNVYPAAGFVQIAARAGADCVELNLERSLGADYFDRSIQGPASAIVPAFVARLLAGEPAS